jgi:hypothetical protein
MTSSTDLIVNLLKVNIFKINMNTNSYIFRLSYGTTKDDY